MSKPVVVCDVDDVILDFVVAWCEWLNEKYQTHVLSSDIKEWDVTKFFPGLTRDQVYEPFSNPDFWDTVQPLKGAKYALYRLNNDYDLWLCTKCHLDTGAIKYEHAIKKHFPFIDQNKIIIASRKQMVDCDYIVDDNPKNLLNHSAQKILIEAPHNVGYAAAANGMFHPYNLWYAYITIGSCEELKQLTAEEFDVCDKIARKTHMDAWFGISQTPKGIDNVYDWELHTLLPLSVGIRLLAEGAEEVYKDLWLSKQEDGVFRNLLDRVKYGRTTEYAK